MTKYDLIIIGAGPAAYTASIYASRYKLRHIVVGEKLGGLAIETDKICNFPSEEEISGINLIKKMEKQVKNLKINILNSKIIDIKETEDGFYSTTENEEKINSKTVLLATGTKSRKLEINDENKFIGRGISYCATCDALFYQNKNVAVIGGSDSAQVASLYLSKIAKRVYQIYRKDKLRGDPTWIEQIKKNKKIDVIYNNNVQKLMGDKTLDGIILERPYQGNKSLKIDGLFVKIGSTPNGLLPNKLKLDQDKQGYINVDNSQQTSLRRVWAAGDVTTASNKFKQIITACSEGAIAAESIFNFIQKNQ